MARKTTLTKNNTIPANSLFEWLQISNDVDYSTDLSGLTSAVIDNAETQDLIYSKTEIDNKDSVINNKIISVSGDTIQNTNSISTLNSEINNLSGETTVINNNITIISGDTTVISGQTVNNTTNINQISGTTIQNTNNINELSGNTTPSFLPVNYTNTGDTEIIDNHLEGIDNELLTRQKQVVEVKTISGTTYTLQNDDGGKYLRFTNSSPVTVTVPSGLTWNVGEVTTFRQAGLGQITLSAAVSTLNTADSGGLKTEEQGSEIQTTYVANNVHDTRGGVA